MPIYRCNSCGFVNEETLAPVHTKTPCGRCSTPTMVYDTVFFVEQLVKRLAAATRNLKTLQTQQTQPAVVADTAVTADAISTDLPHALLQQWFVERKIEAQLDASSVDTSGFFDEAATSLGSNYSQFADLLGRVRYAYRKSYSTVQLELNQLSQKDGQAINQFCRTLYEHTFFARYHYQKQDKVVRLTLQTAPAIRQFFEGGWLEWYALMQLLDVIGNDRSNYSYARNAKVIFPNEDLHELDVLCLPAGQLPICIECKSGEFRRDIDKYLRLSKRLGLPKERFIICSTELNEEQAQGLSAMYDLRFVTLTGLTAHLRQLL